VFLRHLTPPRNLPLPVNLIRIPTSPGAVACPVSAHPLALALLLLLFELLSIRQFRDLIAR